MKRRKPLKRSALARGEKPLKRRAPAEGSSDLRRGPRQAKQRTGAEAWGEARARTGGRCLRCGARGVGEAHHVLPKRLFPELTTDPRNLVWLCRPCHARHESAHDRLPLGLLPACCFDAAADVGDRALLFIQRTYPADRDS